MREVDAFELKIALRQIQEMEDRDKASPNLSQSPVWLAPFWQYVFWFDELFNPSQTREASRTAGISPPRPSVDQAHGSDHLICYRNRHHIRTGFMGAQRLVMSRKVEDIVDQKAHVALGGLVLRHVDSPFGLAVRYHHATAMREPATIIVGGLNAAP